jgi:hypothetical protein
MWATKLHFETFAFPLLLAASLSAFVARPINAQGNSAQGQISFEIRSTDPNRRAFIGERETVWLYLQGSGTKWRLIGSYDWKSLAGSDVTTFVLKIPAGDYWYSLIKPTERIEQPFTKYDCWNNLRRVRSGETVRVQIPEASCGWRNVSIPAEALPQGFAQLRKLWADGIDFCARWRQKLTRAYRELVVTPPSRPVATLPIDIEDSRVLLGVSQYDGDREWTATQVPLFRDTLKHHCGRPLLHEPWARWPSRLSAEERALADELQDRLRYELAELDKLITSIADTLEDIERRKN